MRYAIVAAVVLGGALAAWLTIETRRNRLVLDHFDVVKHGILYRSGQLNADQLDAVVVGLRVKTLVNFQIAGEGVEYERAVARKYGIDFLNLPMPGDGFGEEAQFREVLKACDDPHRRPVLIHCARGTCRTGSAVALYRFERDGWTIEDVSVEMRRQSYYLGWLPGYVYAMAKNKPHRDLFEPKITYDRNLPEPPPPPPEREIVPVVAGGQPGDSSHVR
jgi:protein-tyrosine phosphatase